MEAVDEECVFFFFTGTENYGHFFPQYLAEQ